MARLVAPRGWDVVRLPVDPEAAREREDDLEALANAVMQTKPRERRDTEPVGQGVEVSRRGHLRVLKSGPPAQDR